MEGPTDGLTAGSAWCGEDLDITLTLWSVSKVTNVLPDPTQKRALTRTLGDPVRAKMKVERMVTVIGGKADKERGGKIQVKLRGRWQAFTACSLK